jgi:hypothetical protein
LLALLAILCGVASQRKSLATLSRGYVLYYFQPFAQASLARSENNKALLRKQQGFIFVAEEGFEPPTFGL